MQNRTEKHKISAAKLDFACLKWKVFKLYMRIHQGPFKYAQSGAFFSLFGVWAECGNVDGQIMIDMGATKANSLVPIN